MTGFAGGREWRRLLVRLVWREVSGRYRGSLLGLGWSIVQPLAMLAIYSFVFGTVFRARWNPSGAESPFEFALALFAGLIVFNLFAEVATRAPGLVAANPNFVKKVVFPLDLLPLTALGAALFHVLTSLAVLLAGLAFGGRLGLWALALPLALLPFCLFLAGLAWLLASLGVFLRDIGQLAGMAVTALLFLSPVFYPATALPEALRGWLYLNPLAVPIEAVRDLLIWNRPPAMGAFALHALAATIFARLGYLWFEKTRKGFADVL